MGEGGGGEGVVQGGASRLGRVAGTVAPLGGEGGGAGEKEAEGRRRLGRWGEGEGGPAQTEKTRNDETLGATMEVSHRGRRPSLESRRKPLIDRDSEVRSMNQDAPQMKPSMRRSQRYPRIPHMMHGLGVIARRSCRRSWNRFRISASNSGSRELNLRKQFYALERARWEEARHIYSSGSNEMKIRVKFRFYHL
jgi:hypothetical protein